MKPHNLIPNEADAASVFITGTEAAAQNVNDIPADTASSSQITERPNILMKRKARWARRAAR